MFACTFPKLYIYINKVTLKPQNSLIRIIETWLFIVSWVGNTPLESWFGSVCYLLNAIKSPPHILGIMFCLSAYWYWCTRKYVQLFYDISHECSLYKQRWWFVFSDRAKNYICIWSCTSRYLSNIEEISPGNKRVQN